MDRKRQLSKRITELIGKLPLFPRDIETLLTSALKPSADDMQVLRLIKGDPELCKELSELAGTYYGIEEAETAEVALERIGVQPLVQLIGLSYARKAVQEEFASLRYLNEYFEHSEEISIGCHVLAEVSGRGRDEAQMYAVAGLIHDIGRLAMMVANNRTSAHVLGTLWDKMASVVYDEKTATGTNHCEVGREICRKWKFAPIIQEGVLRHHNPLINGDFSFPGGVIFVAHFLSASDPSGDIVSRLSAGEILSLLHLSAAEFDRARAIYKSRT
jgi:HD-like signal output (HDOD) protein